MLTDGCWYDRVLWLQFGNYPIHMAATGGHIEAIQLINKSNGFSDVDLKDKAGFTPLALAVSNQMTEAAIVLLLAGADPSIPLPVCAAKPVETSEPHVFPCPASLATASIRLHPCRCPIFHCHIVV